MSDQYAIVPFTAQAAPVELSEEFGPRLLAEQYGSDLLRLLSPWVQELHTSMDLRPLRTLVQTVEALVTFRDSTHGLLLTELGSHLDGLGGGGGGTKRLLTLIRHRQWKARQIDDFLWHQADDQIRQWEQLGEDGLVLWDGTVEDQPESLAPEGLCAVRSSKAVRLTHVKRGYPHPPGAPIFVPGMPGIGLLLAGRHGSLGPPRLISMHWWSSRGALASHEKDENCKLLRQATQWWGRRVVHIFDRGYASGPWLGALRGFDARFILRWKLKSHLVTAAGVKQAAWQIARGKVGLAPRTRWDAVHHCNVQGSAPKMPGKSCWPTLVAGVSRSSSAI